MTTEQAVEAIREFIEAFVVQKLDTPDVFIITAGIRSAVVIYTENEDQYTALAKLWQIAHEAVEAEGE